MKRKGSSPGTSEPLDVETLHGLLRAPLALSLDDPRRIPAIQDALRQLTPSQFYLLERQVGVDDLIRNYNYLYHPGQAPVPVVHLPEGRGGPHLCPGGIIICYFHYR